MFGLLKNREERRLQEEEKRKRKLAGRVSLRQRAILGDRSASFDHHWTGPSGVTHDGEDIYYFADWKMLGSLHKGPKISEVISAMTDEQVDVAFRIVTTLMDSHVSDNDERLLKKKYVEIIDLAARKMELKASKGIEDILERADRLENGLRYKESVDLMEKATDILEEHPAFKPRFIKFKIVLAETENLKDKEIRDRQFMLIDKKLDEIKVTYDADFGTSDELSASSINQLINDM